MAEEEHDKKKSHSHGGGHGPGGGSHEEHEGAPEWLISFADNVTLMMGFFVVMLAVNMKPAASGAGNAKEPGYAEPSPELLDAQIAIRQAFHNPVDPNSSNPIDLPLIQRLVQRTGESRAEQAGQAGVEHDVRSIRPSDYYSTAGQVPFDDGSDALGARSRSALGQIIPQLKGHNLIIEIRGHVSAAESFEKPDRGMQLSYDRALNVATALTAEGIGWRQLRLIGCADGERLVPIAYDASGHRTNQRVELIVTDRVVEDTSTNKDQPQSQHP